MAANEIMDLGFSVLMQVLEFVHRAKLDDIETVGKNPIWFTFQEMFGFVRGDMRYGGENIGAMGRAPLDAVAVVDSTFTRFVVHVEVLEVVVKIDTAGAEVSTQERRVRGKDRGDVDVSFAAERDGEAGLPLVEVRDDGFAGLVRDVLDENQR